MSTPANSGHSELLKRALVAIDQLEAKLAAVERRRTEPIAIVGVGCRLPGGMNDLGTFRQALLDGRDLVTEVPPDRWDVDAYFDPDPDAPGKSYTRWGAFVPGVDLFDAQFFGISRREALSLDPQQRMVLETSWEALENAGIAPASLAGSDTAVYLGISTFDQAVRLIQPAALARADAYASSGSAHSVASGRLSYFLGLHGPNFAVDTACSSSLVAIHTAVRSLRTGESSLALAGGVSVMISPAGSILTSRARMMSFDGRCKTFDASADGYVRGEGSVMVVLKRQSDAVRDGDRILALIRGSAINQDGRSSGLTAPNGGAQQKVVRAALADAGLRPDQIGYVEAHGTGTSLGDPIEMEALGAVFADRGDAGPLLVGSVKTNVGHLEAAAGVAGLVKALVAVQGGVIPPHLHLTEPSPMIPWESIPIEVPTRTRDWSGALDAPRRAGISSFGFSGTNAHLVIEQALPVTQAAPLADDGTPQLLALSAQSPDGLRELAARYAARFGEAGAASLRDVARSTWAGRSVLGERLAIVGRDWSDVAPRLAAFARAEDVAGVARGSAASGVSPEVVFMFTGQGAQFVGMALGLRDAEPVFREALDRCAALLGPHLDRPLLDVIAGAGEPGLLDDTRYTQPALFAVEYALACLWRSRGVEPTVVLGHSVGEYVAACVAGVFGLEDALSLIALRGRLMSRLPRDGAMAAVFTDEARVRDALAREPLLSIAAVNGPGNVVVSGDERALGRILATFSEDGIDTQPLKVSHAFHSAKMDPILDEFEAAAARVAFGRPQVGLVSNVTGRLAGDEVCSARYWRAHLREAVRFGDSLQGLYREGLRVFVEIGPQPVLIGMARRGDAPADAAFVPTLRKGRDDAASVLEAVGQLHVLGTPLPGEVLWGSDARRHRVDLPTYPFQRRRFWIDIEDPVAVPAGSQQAPNEVVEQSADWCFETHWNPSPASAAKAGPVTGSWLVLGDEAGLGDRVADALRHEGANVCTVRSGERFEMAPDRCVLDPGIPSHWDRLLSAAAGLQGVVSLWPLDTRIDGAWSASGVDRAVSGSIARTLPMLKAIAELSVGFWQVSRGAQEVTGSVVDPLQGPLWGLAGVVASECPALRCVRLDLDPRTSPEDVGQIVESLRHRDDEPRVAWRAGRRHVARLRPHVLGRGPAGASPDASAIRADATYLVTGGLGGLGMVVADWLVSKGARHVVLSSRRPPGGPAEALIGRLRAAGAEVRVQCVDVADEQSVSAMIEDIGASMPPLRGVLHAAGVIDDAMLQELDLARFGPVIAPKVRGAFNLHQATRGLALDFFVMFSSGAALTGAPGQGNYAAANTFMDALAFQRRSEGLPALSVNWGSWSGAGMAASVDVQHQRRWDAMGLKMIDPATGVAMLEAMIRSGRTAQLAAMPLVRSRLPQESGPFFSELRGDASAVNGTAPATKDLRKDLEAAPPSSRVPLMTDFLTRLLVRVLALGPNESVDPTRSVMAMGLDSLMAMEMRNRIQSAIGARIQVADLMKGPSLMQLSTTVLTASGLSGATEAETDESAWEEGTL